MTDWQGPFSEGAVSPRHGPVALRMLRDAVKRRPLLYSWGHGGHDESIVKLLKGLGWLLAERRRASAPTQGVRTGMR